MSFKLSAISPLWNVGTLRIIPENTIFTSIFLSPQWDFSSGRRMLPAFKHTRTGWPRVVGVEDQFMKEDHKPTTIDGGQHRAREQRKSKSAESPHADIRTVYGIFPVDPARRSDDFFAQRAFLARDLASLGRQSIGHHNNH